MDVFSGYSSRVSSLENNEDGVEASVGRYKNGVIEGPNLQRIWLVLRADMWKKWYCSVSEYENSGLGEREQGRRDDKVATRPVAAARI